MSNPGHPNPLSSHAATAKVAAFLDRFISAGRLDLQFRQITQPEGVVAAPSPEALPSSPANAILTLEFTGSDTPILLARNGEALHALEYMAARILRIESDQHELISFDADNFKQNRVLELQAAVDAAVQSVRTTGRPYAFPPMSSRERRMLHLAVAASGLPTSSKGENPRRYVILYPEGYLPPEPLEPQQSGPSSEDRTHAIRQSFRRR